MIRLRLSAFSVSTNLRVDFIPTSPKRDRTVKATVVFQVSSRQFNAFLASRPDT